MKTTNMSGRRGDRPKIVGEYVSKVLSRYMKIHALHYVQYCRLSRIEHFEDSYKIELFIAVE